MSKSRKSTSKASSGDLRAYTALFVDVEFRFDSKGSAAISAVTEGVADFDAFRSEIELLVARFINASKRPGRVQVAGAGKRYKQLLAGLDGLRAARRAIEVTPASSFFPSGLEGGKAVKEMLRECDSLILKLEAAASRGVPSVNGRPPADLADAFTLDLQKLWEVKSGRTASRSTNRSGFLNFVDTVAAAAGIGDVIKASRAARLLKRAGAGQE